MGRSAGKRREVEGEREMNHLMDTVDRLEVSFDYGYGPILLSREDKRFLDFFCDSGAASLGYAPFESHDILARFSTTSAPIHLPNMYRSPIREEAAKTLCGATLMDKVFFSNSGSEAVETAIKIARLGQWKRGNARQRVYGARHSFHGRTYGALAAGDGPKYHYEGFGPMPAGFHKFEQIPGFTYLKDDPTRAAAIIVSPVFDNKDVVEPVVAQLSALREYCDRHGPLERRWHEASGQTCWDQAVTSARLVVIRSLVLWFWRCWNGWKLT
jgi:acetylornithine/succinyldiaminopimelate/putrescine aminotransferase